jgi:hypothetical protein
MQHARCTLLQANVVYSSALVDVAMCVCAFKRAGGFASVSVEGPQQQYTAGGGGGAVAVVWAASDAFIANVSDVVFLNNSVLATVIQGVTGEVFLGGGALYVSGGGSQSLCQVANSVFVGNRVTVQDYSTGRVSRACGGGLCALQMMASAAGDAEEANPPRAGTFSMSNTTLRSNSVACGLPTYQCTGADRNP